MIKYLVVCILLSPVMVMAQHTASPVYDSLIKQADSFFAIKQYNISSLLFSKAFSVWAGKGRIDDRYSAACSWSLAGNADSAFFNIERIATKSDYSDYMSLVMEDALIPLHNDKRWLPLLHQVRANKFKKDSGYNISVIRLIDSMIEEDQTWRSHWRRHNNQQLSTSEDSLSNEAIAKKMAMTDSLHYKPVYDIFQQYGFPNYDLVGKDNSDNYWALVQHQSNHPDFMACVLERMGVEIDHKKATGEKYAFLQDRINFEFGKPQVYGTQMVLNADSTAYVPAPIIDRENVNERRRKIGLNFPIEDYINYYNKRFRAPKK